MSGTSLEDDAANLASFQDLLAQLAAVHNRDLLSAKTEHEREARKLRGEVQSLRAKLEGAGVSAEELEVVVEKGESDHSLDRAVSGTSAAEEPKTKFAVKKEWEQKLQSDTWGKKLDSLMVRYSRRRDRHAARLGLENAALDEVQEACQATVISPNSNFRLGWDLCGLGLITFDLFEIPFNQAFLPPPTVFSLVMDKIAQLFWTGDLIQGFFLGYYEKGRYIANNRQVILHYLRTWFLIDILVVGPEWVVLLAGSFSSHEGEQVNLWAKIFKGARAIRVLRLLRLLKLQRIINLLYDLIESEWTFIVLNLAKLLIFVLVLNHVIACVWFWIGRLTMESDQENWIEAGSVNGTSLAYSYTTSLHWSLTQFTPASMDISARNTSERIFSIIVLFFALVTFSSIVASITGSTTCLRNMKTDEMKQFWLLRRYLRQRNVSNELSNRIFKFLEHQLKIQSRLVQKENIKILTSLSEALQNEMTHQMHSPHLLKHPFFHHLNTHIKALMHRLCRYVIKPQSYAEKETIFSWGDSAKRMYFIKSGRLQYTTVTVEGTKKEALEQKDWISEAVLWTDWRHQGDLTAETASDLIAVDPARFVEEMGVHPRPWYFAKEYAMHFVNKLNQMDRAELSDIARDTSFFEEAVRESESLFFAGIVSESSSRYISEKTTTTQDPEDEAEETDAQLFGKGLTARCLALCPCMGASSLTLP